MQLTWTSPTDNGCSGVSSYDIYRNGTFLASTPNTSHTDSSTSSGVTYQYYVIAKDNLGNASAPSNTATITVGGGGGGGGGGAPKENCTDGIDNDGDGQIDCADSNCSKNRACR